MYGRLPPAAVVTPQVQENAKAGAKPAAGAKAGKAKPAAGAKKGARGKDSGKKGASEKRPSEVEPPAPDSSKPEVCGILCTAAISFVSTGISVGVWLALRPRVRDCRVRRNPQVNIHACTEKLFNQ